MGTCMSVMRSRLVFHAFAALAAFIRELSSRAPTRALAAARARGQRLGRPPAMTPEQRHRARVRWYHQRTRLRRPLEHAYPQLT